MNISELLSSPSMIHAAVVHMPIAAAFLGLIFIVISAIFHRNNTVRALTALLFLILAVSAYVAIETGEDARDLVPSEMPKAVWDQVTAHAKSAEKVLYAGLFCLACVLVSLVRVDVVRNVALLLAAVGALATNIFVANTGHLGGALVYNEGVGTPFVHQSAAPAAPTPAPAEPVAVQPISEPVVPMPELVEPAPVEPMPEPGQPEATPTPSEPVPAPAAVADNPDWLPIREFTLEEAAQVSYKRDVWPIIDDQCIVCHENPDADGDYDMTTVANMLLAGKKGGPGVVPGKPDESSIIKYIRGIANPRMPEDEPPLPDEMLHTLRMWIAAGAIDDTNVPETPAADAAVEAPAPEAPATPELSPDVSEGTPPAEVEAAPAPTPESEVPAETPPTEAPASAPATDSAPAV